MINTSKYVVKKIHVMKNLSLIIAILIYINGPKSVNAQCETLPFCDFSYTIGPDGLSITFDGLTNCDPGLKVKWDFGDGIILDNSQEDVNHIFTESGQYVVKMIVTSASPCNLSYTHQEVVTIEEGVTSQLSVSLTGPTLAAVNQCIIYNAVPLGGVPPYSASWDFEEVPSECGESSSLTKKVSYQTASISGYIVSVTITDGANNTATAPLIRTKVKPDLQPLGIITNGPPSQDPNHNSDYDINTQITFFPDIKPNWALDYPTDYYWDFDDNTFEYDNYDGGGFKIHSYSMPGIKNVTLTVTDPNGTMQATKSIKIFDPAGGGQPSCYLETEGHPGENTVEMDYKVGINTLPSKVDINFVNNGSCTIPLIYTWDISFPDCGADPKYDVTNYPNCDGQYDHFQLDLTGFFNNCWEAILGGQKVWGCIGLHCNESGSGGTNCCYASNPCIVYIKPDEFTISEITATGSCQDYLLSASVTGGGWSKIEPTLYSSYEWTAFDSNHPDEKIDDLLIPVSPNNPLKRKINLNHPYIKQFRANQFVEFMVKLVVYDYANQRVETNQLISINPFRLHFKDNYSRCPGITSKLDILPLATGGSGKYSYNWSGGLTGENPDITAPQQGVDTYSVTVTDVDEQCTMTASFTIKGVPVQVDLPTDYASCESNGGAQFFSPGPADPTNLGGSGYYDFLWSTSNPSDLAYLSDVHIANPVIKNIPAGQSITYTLTVTDKYGACTASDQVVVTSFANDLSVDLSGPTALCYGTGATLTANGLPTASGWNALIYQYQWSTNNRNHDISTLGLYSNALNISDLVASYPGTYNYKVRYQNIISGCYAEKDMNIVVRSNWRHIGYNPSIEAARLGTAVPLWDENSNNSITSGIQNLNNIDVSWWPAPPTTIEYNPDTPYLPKNGTFTPTIANPYRIMTVTDKQTGCQAHFKSKRYLLTDQAPKIWISADNLSACDGGDICFDVFFDAHVVGTSSMLPQFVEVRYYINNISYNSGNKYIKLSLMNRYGLYHQKVCIDAPPFTQALPWTEYNFNAQLSPDNIWDYSATESITFYVSPIISNQQPLSDCSPTYGIYYRPTIDLGKSPCQPNPLLQGGTYKFMAQKYVEVHPDGGIELVPDIGSNGSHYGPLLMINPCINTTSPEQSNTNLTRSEEDESLQSGDPRKADISKSGLLPAEISLEVQPNPFSRNLHVEYAVNSENPVKVMVSLYDFTGKLIKVLKENNYETTGKYAFDFDAGLLPPGLYLCQLTVENNGQITKKIAKVGF